MDLYTVAEFHEAMKKIKDGEDVYSIRTTKTNSMDKTEVQFDLLVGETEATLSYLKMSGTFFLHLDYIQPWGLLRDYLPYSELLISAFKIKQQLFTLFLTKEST